MYWARQNMCVQIQFRAALKRAMSLLLLFCGRWLYVAFSTGDEMEMDGDTMIGAVYW